MIADRDQTIRILIVDDDEDVRRLVEAFLEGRGLEVETAATGEEALAHLERGPTPDLGLFDIQLPGLSGLEVLARLPDSMAPKLVVMMTGVGSEEIAVEALRLGAADYLRKPLKPSELQSALERVLERVRADKLEGFENSLLDVRRQALEAEMSRLGRTQAALVPALAPQGIEIVAETIKAAEVASDLFDWWTPAPGLFNLIVGEVGESGVAAGYTIAMARGVLRASFRDDRPAACFERAVSVLLEDLTRTSVFVRLLMGQLNIDTGEFVFVDAGLGLGFVRQEGNLRPLEFDGETDPIGVRGGRINSGQLTLGPGDLVGFCSRGLPKVQPGNRHALDAVLSGAPLTGDGASLLNHFLGPVRGRAVEKDVTALVMRLS